MDALDKQLVELLAKDAWQSADVLAKQLNIGTSTVRRRIKRLLKDGVIRVVALSDPDKVGLPVTALITLDVSADRVDAVMQKLENLPEVRWASVTIGRFDVIAFLRVSSTDRLFQFIQHELAKMEGIKNTETFICVHTLERGRHLRL